VRSELSEVKGGGLRRLAGDTRCVSIILSDVLGNDPTVIASGPTIARETDPGKALEILAHYGLSQRVPEAVITLLQSSTHGAIASTVGADDVFTVVGDNETFVAGVARAAEQDGLRVAVELRLAEGEASDVATTFLKAAAASDVDVVLGGGETTVTVRGEGIGGRNTEFALAAALDLSESRAPWVVASLASDGQDGRIDAAGAIADRDTVPRARALGLDPVTFHHQNDSGTFFQRLGDLVEPGPTGTNVNDVYIAVRFDPEQQETHPGA
jgi:hydroxypyruvate reductase